MRDFDAVASLGCRYSPADADVPQVQAEIELIARAVEHDVPVLGLCFGGQVLAHVLGGDGSRPRRRPSSAGTRSRPTSRTRSRPARGCCGTTSASPSRPARPRSPAPRTPRRPSATAGTSACSSTPNPPPTSSKAGPARTPRSSGPSASTNRRALIDAPDERKDAAKQAAFRLFDAFTRRERMIEERGLMARPPELSDQSVTSVRVVYSDLHGVARGKDVPIGEFDRAAEHGLAFCSAIMGTDLRHTPVVGGEEGYPDLVAKPDLSTLTLLPWEPGVACCIADLEPVSGTQRHARRPARRRPQGRRGVRGARLRADRRPGARVLPLRRRPGRAQRHPPLRRQPEHGLHGRPAGGPEGRRAPDHRVALAARAWTRSRPTTSS